MLFGNFYILDHFSKLSGPFFLRKQITILGLPFYSFAMMENKFIRSLRVEPHIVSINNNTIFQNNFSYFVKLLFKALILAYLNGSTEIVKMLLEQEGIEINAKTVYLN